MKEELEKRKPRLFLFRRIVVFLFAVAICVLFSKIVFADVDNDKVDNARATLEKWVETRRIISDEQRDWVLGEEMINERIKLVQREIKSLCGKISESEKTITDTDENRSELIEENKRLKEASTVLNQIVSNLEDRTKGLLQRLPDAIHERVKPLSQRFPEDTEDTNQSLSERFQNIVGVLNEINKFNREITATSEVRMLPDGTSAEVTVLYVGIGQAYYASTKGDIAGTGSPSDEGWKWMPANDASEQIVEAIAILKNEKAASFVQLPITIQ